MQVTRYRNVEEAYRFPVVLGLGALAFELVIAATLVVRVP